MKQVYCICCQNERNGLDVEEDGIIRTMRAAKSAIGMKTNQNRLVWCKACYPDHLHIRSPAGGIDTAPIEEFDADRLKNPVKVQGYEDRRRRYETRQIMYVGLGVLFAIVGLVISASVQTLGTAILLVAFLYVLSLLTYVPKLKVRS